jgi:hypothetical protein
MDFGECLRCGLGEISPSCFRVDRVKDRSIFGLFPAFMPYLRRDHMRERFGSLVARLGEFDPEVSAQVVADIPDDWEVRQSLTSAAGGFLRERAVFLVSMIPRLIDKACSWHQPEELAR